MNNFSTQLSRPIDSSIIVRSTLIFINGFYATKAPIVRYLTNIASFLRFSPLFDKKVYVGKMLKVLCNI